MRGCLRNVLMFIGGLVVLIVVIVIVASVIGAPSDQASPGNDVRVVPTWTPTSMVEAGSAVEAESAAVDTLVPPAASPTASPTAPPTAVDLNRGIRFGTPVLFRQGGFTSVGLLADNTTDQVKSFTVKATFKAGDQIVATAVGAVNDMLPGQRRAVMLMAAEEIPGYDSVRVDVDTMVREAETTGGAQIAQRQRFGPVAVNDVGGFITADVEVTNGDDDTHSYTVQAAWLAGDQLVGVGSGAVNDIAPGQTKTVSLLITGEANGPPTLLYIETVIR